MIDLLEKYYQATPGKNAFIAYGAGNERKLTYESLAVYAGSLGSQLIPHRNDGKVAILIFRDVFDFIPAFLACQFAGIIPVPVLFTNSKRQLHKIRQIQSDSGATLILTDEDAGNMTGQSLSDFFQGSDCEIINTRFLPADQTIPDFRLSVKNPTAFIQYTSGSTNNPKGVVISQENLICNQRMINQVFGTDQESVLLSWLPFQHDMGLVGNILHNIYMGTTCILQSPFSFMQRPLSWLQGITEYKVTHSGAPNFAYDYCVNRIPDKEKESLDLSSWRVAFNGSEPVHQETMKRFAASFEMTGFNYNSFYPCYGLAEATLLVSGKRHNSEILTATPATDMNGDQTLPKFVSCGTLAEGTELQICKEGRICREGEEGEILLFGKSITEGYWNRDNNDTFLLLNNKVYLRTGDLGFMKNGELFICGRTKEMLIVRGVNLYPYEVERQLAQLFKEIEENGVALIQSNIGTEDEIILVTEIKRTVLNSVVKESLIAALEKETAGLLGVSPYDIVLIQPMSMPRTTSGKIRRIGCREMYETSTLKMVASKRTMADPVTETNSPDISAISVFISNSAALKEYVARLAAGGSDNFRIREDEYDESLFSLGLDSLRLTTMVNRLNTDLSIQLDLDTVIQCRSLNDLIREIQALLWVKHATRKGGRVVI